MAELPRVGSVLATVASELLPSEAKERSEPDGQVRLAPRSLERACILVAVDEDPRSEVVVEGRIGDHQARGRGRAPVVELRPVAAVIVMERRIRDLHVVRL